ncbi:MAG TPA: MFS transporter [Candidatus Dormibacteraeota bacterium]|jgi:NNP family nitrate/nitrite transporter-like MFS transporter
MRSPTRALALATLAFTTCFYSWALLGPLAPGLQQQLRLSEVQVGWMVAIPVVMGSVMRIPMGIVTDRFGARRTFPILMILSALPLAALAVWHQSFWPLVVFGFLLGLAGSSFAVGVPFVSRWYAGRSQGAALGVYGMGMGGTVLAALTAPTIADRLGYAAPFVLGAVLLVGVGALFAWAAREAPVTAAAPANVLESLMVFRRDPRAWALTLFYFLAFGGFVAMFLYLPKLLVGVYGLGRTDAAARAAGFALLAVLARPLGGWLADRIGARSVLLLSFAAGAVLAATLTGFYQQIAPLTAACLCLGVAFGLGTGAVFKMVGEEFPGRVGAVTGVVGAAGGLGGFFPPIVLATVKAATGSYALAFLLLSATAVACLAVLTLMGGRSAAGGQPVGPGEPRAAGGSS